MSRIKIEIATKMTSQGEDTYGRYVKVPKGKKPNRGAIDKFIKTYAQVMTLDKQADRIIQNMSDLSLPALMKKFATHASSTCGIESVYREIRESFGRLPAGAADCVYDIQAIKAAKTTRIDLDELESNKHHRRGSANTAIAGLARHALWGEGRITLKAAIDNYYGLGYEPEDVSCSVGCNYTGEHIFTLANNEKRIAYWRSQIRTNKDGTQNKADIRYMNVRSAPRSNYSNLVFTQGFIQDFYRDTKSECGRVRSAVPEIKRFVLVFAPQEIRGAHYAFGVGFHKGYFWLYVLRLVESAGTWLAVEAKLAKDAEETDSRSTNTSSTWSVNRTQLTQFVEQMYYGDTA